MVSRVFLLLIAFCIAHARSNHIKNATMPENCKSGNYCFDKSKDYPEEMIYHIFIRMNPQLAASTTIMGYRDSTNAKREYDGCVRNINMEPIYEIVDVDDNVRYVIQYENIFLQKIRTEACNSTSPINPSFMFRGMNMTCEEKRIEYWFLVLSLDETRFEYVRLKGDLPVCCSGQLKSR